MWKVKLYSSSFDMKLSGYFMITYVIVNPLATTPQNSQTHSNNSSATADKLFECVWPFCEVGA